MQFRLIQSSFRGLVDTLKQSMNSNYTSTTDTKMAAFIVFIIGGVVAYLILWTPFVSRLNREVTIFDVNEFILISFYL